MAPPAIARKHQYCTNGRLEIRTIGTEDWHKPPAYEGYLDDGPCNVVRPLFSPGSISIFQQAAKPDVTDTSRLKSASYMWKATLNVAELQGKSHNMAIRKRTPLQKNRIERLEVCKAPRTGSALMVAEGVHTSDVYHEAEDTSEPTASGVALANLSDRWASGKQEVHLTVPLSAKVIFWVDLTTD